MMLWVGDNVKMRTVAAELRSGAVDAVTVPGNVYIYKHTSLLQIISYIRRENIRLSPTERSQP
ncbi:hypothetical protein FKP32DRAFT_1596384 [Trametes sanguinea]|nr:hypothetical protein FKP32DRAFT_1596384 [Trametes sanguinea]